MNLTIWILQKNYGRSAKDTSIYKSILLSNLALHLRHLATRLSAGDGIPTRSSNLIFPIGFNPDNYNTPVGIWHQQA